MQTRPVARFIPQAAVRWYWSGDDLVDGGDCVIGRVVFD